MRVRRGVTRHRKHKKLLQQAKGFYGQRNSIFKRAKEALLKAGNFAYRDRRVKKREFRRQWIRVINAACRNNDMKYSEFINGLKKANIELDRKILADLAENNQEIFAQIIKQVKTLTVSNNVPRSTN